MRCASIPKQAKRAGLALEAISCLLFARCCIVLLPVRLISPYFPFEPQLQADRAVTFWVATWVSKWAHYVPWRAKCFEQAIASKIMLRRRGYASLLHLGVKRENDHLIAHAWLEGTDSAGFFALNHPAESS